MTRRIFLKQTLTVAASIPLGLASAFGQQPKTPPRTEPPPGNIDPALLEPRFIFSTYTPNSGCGGTDGDVYLVLEGDNGVRYPRPGYWFVLDNDGNDRERGDTDSYWLETGSMSFVRRCKLYFRYLADADAWQVGDCTLNKHTWNPTLGRWQISQFINRWQYNRCLRDTGWYTRSSDGPFQTQGSQRVRQQIERDPQLLSDVLDLATAAGAVHAQSVPRDNASIARMPVGL